MEKWFLLELWQATVKMSLGHSVVPGSIEAIYTSVHAHTQAHACTWTHQRYGKQGACTVEKLDKLNLTQVLKVDIDSDIM